MDSNEYSPEEEFLNRFLSEEFLAEQERLHRKMDEHLKQHYDYEHDEEEVRRLLDDEDDDMFSALCHVGPVHLLIHEYTPGVLKRKA